MSKFKKLISVFVDILKQPSLLNIINDRNENWKKKIKLKHPNYSNGFPILPIDKLSQDKELEVHPYSFLDGGSLPTDLGLLKLLAKQYNAKNYFEIGTWRGESAANIAPLVNKCYTLNLSKEELKQMDKSDEYINMHRFYSNGIPNINHLEGNSLNYDFDSLKTKFDLIFIDGDHHYNGVKNDTVRVFKHLVHEKSIVVWHDYAFSPENIRHEVFHGILDGLPDNVKQNIYHVSNTLCAVYIPNIDNSIETYKMNPPLTPSKEFKVTIKLRD